MIFCICGITGLAIGQATEYCFNGLDDDADGFIDLNDDDCICEVIAPVSRIPNPSFEILDCCPQGLAELACAERWEQASLATTDLIHECGFMGFRQFPPPLPFPDGQGVVGFRDGRKFDNSDAIQNNWKEYAGACLNAPLLKGLTYRFEFYIGFVSASISPEIDVTFFGTNSCDYMPYDFSDEEFGCPTNSPYWKELSHLNIGSNRGWRKVSLDVTPDEDIYAIAIGPSCEPTGARISTYYFLDNLILDEASDFEWVIRQDGHPCNGEFTISVPDRSDHTYQWYKEGIALTEQRSSSITGLTEGTYQVRVDNGISCFTAAPYYYSMPVIEDSVTVYKCEDEVLNFGDQQLTEVGDYEATFLSYQGCDSIVYLKLEEFETITDTIYAKVFEGDDYILEGQIFSEKGTHFLSLVDDAGCNYSLYLMLEHYDVFWPNVFSPNNDGNNDYFTIYGGPELINIKELSLYSRWGGKVYQGSNLLPNQDEGWDGRISGQDIAGGVYVFHAVLEMEGGITKDLIGNVLVAR